MKSEVRFEQRTIIKKRGEYRITYAVRVGKTGKVWAKRIAVQFIGKAKVVA